MSPPEQLDEYLWVITLNEKAEWIEEGRPEPYDMKPGLLKDGKTTKDGKNKYRVVPMNQGKTPSQMSPNTAGYEQNMVNKVKSELKARGIPYKKLEMESAVGRKTGNIIDKPKIGRLHRFDIDSYTPGKGNTPQLHGLHVHQTASPKVGGGTIRTMTTFRTVTDKDNQKDKWIHPSVEGKKFFEEAQKWAQQEWESKWLPQILEKYRG